MNRDQLLTIVNKSASKLCLGQVLSSWLNAGQKIDLSMFLSNY